jgi:cytochrome c peroxidase
MARSPPIRPRRDIKFRAILPQPPHTNIAIEALLSCRIAASVIGGLCLLASLAIAGEVTPATTAADTSGPRIELGRALFFDARLSARGDVSCASCHQPDRQYADGRPASTGTGGVALTRNAPSLLDVGERQALFWDGRVASLEQQVFMPLLNPGEQGMASMEAVTRLLQSSPEYAPRFAAAFPALRESPTADAAAKAIAAFERTLVSGDSAFDRYLRAGEDAAFDASARRGWELFRGAAGCAACHPADLPRARLTDDDYHASPLPLPRRALARLPTLISQARALHGRDDGQALGAQVARDGALASLGRFLATLDPHDIGRFRTPSLRNVARTAPYMHDGSVATLERAVDLELYRDDGPLRKPVQLSPQERADLLAFLRSLSTPTQDKP